MSFFPTSCLVSFLPSPQKLKCQDLFNTVKYVFSNNFSFILSFKIKSTLCWPWEITYGIWNHTIVMLHCTHEWISKKFEISRKAAIICLPSLVQAKGQTGSFFLGSVERKPELKSSSGIIPGCFIPIPLCLRPIKMLCILCKFTSNKDLEINWQFC